MNYSLCLRLARELIGPEAFLKRHGTGWRIYTEKGRTRTVYGEGETFEAVIHDCFVLESEMEAEVRGGRDTGSK